MLEDDWLKLRFNAGSRDAMRCVYEKYRNDLLTLAMALLAMAPLAIVTATTAATPTRCSPRLSISSVIATARRRWSITRLK